MHTPLYIAVLAALALPTTAAAEATQSRLFHGSLGVGVIGNLTGDSNYGALISGTVLPGGAWQQLGLHLEARGFADSGAGWLAAGIAYEAGAARPRLSVELYAVAGVTDDATPVIGVGIEAVVAIIGIAAIGLDTGSHIIIDGTRDTSLVLSAALTLRLAR